MGKFPIRSFVFFHDSSRVAKVAKDIYKATVFGAKCICILYNYSHKDLPGTVGKNNCEGSLLSSPLLWLQKSLKMSYSISLNKHTNA